MPSYMFLASHSKNRRGAGRVVWVELDIKELGQVWVRSATARLPVANSPANTYLDLLLGHLRRGIYSRPANTVSIVKSGREGAGAGFRGGRYLEEEGCSQPGEFPFG